MRSILGPASKPELRYGICSSTLDLPKAFRQFARDNGLPIVKRYGRESKERAFSVLGAGELGGFEWLCLSRQTVLGEQNAVFIDAGVHGYSPEGRTLYMDHNERTWTIEGLLARRHMCCMCGNHLSTIVCGAGQYCQLCKDDLTRASMKRNGWSFEYAEQIAWHNANYVNPH